MSIHEIIRKINTDKREIAYFKWKMRGLILGMILLFLVQVGVIIYVILLFK